MCEEENAEEFVVCRGFFLVVFRGVWWWVCDFGVQGDGRCMAMALFESRMAWLGWKVGFCSSNDADVEARRSLTTWKLAAVGGERGRGKGHPNSVEIFIVIF